MRCAVKSTSPSDERSAGNLHATFCGSQERVTAPGDPVRWDARSDTSICCMIETPSSPPNWMNLYGDWGCGC